MRLVILHTVGHFSKNKAQVFKATITAVQVSRSQLVNPVKRINAISLEHNYYK